MYPISLHNPTFKVDLLIIVPSLLGITIGLLAKKILMNEEIKFEKREEDLKNKTIKLLDELSVELVTHLTQKEVVLSM